MNVEADGRFGGDQGVHTRLEALVEESVKKVNVKGVICDGAYDSRRNPLDGHRAHHKG